jgi:hypothetical protein
MVKEIPNVGFLAKARGEDITLSAASKFELRQQIKFLLKKRFHPAIIPQRIRFRFYTDKSINI